MCCTCVKQLHWSTNVSAARNTHTAFILSIFPIKLFFCQIVCRIYLRTKCAQNEESRTNKSLWTNTSKPGARNHVQILCSFSLQLHMPMLPKGILPGPGFLQRMILLGVIKDILREWVRLTNNIKRRPNLFPLVLNLDSRTTQKTGFNAFLLDSRDQSMKPWFRKDNRRSQRASRFTILAPVQLLAIKSFVLCLLGSVTELNEALDVSWTTDTLLTPKPASSQWMAWLSNWTF